jgi:pimeloyl-ACP methyl ester carboxylesterase
MAKTHPVSIANENHGLAGDLILPDGASAEQKVNGAIIIGGPGPLPLTRYDGATPNWPVLWGQALAKAGIATMIYDQRGGGHSSGEYHEADWDALYDDVKAVQELTAVQPEIRNVVGIAWGDGCQFALQLAAEGRLAGLVLLAPAFHPTEERYLHDLRDLAARRGLSERVVQIRHNQWKTEMAGILERVQKGERITVSDVGGQQVKTNLVRFLQHTAFNPGAVAQQVTVPVLILHGEADTAINPRESAALAAALNCQVKRITYPGQGHFLYRHEQAITDTAAWIQEALAVH